MNTLKDAEKVEKAKIVVKQIPDRDRAMELAIQVLNAKPDLLNIPKSSDSFPTSKESVKELIIFAEAIRDYIFYNIGQ